jgi:carbamoyl-phosphate synthase small subunit
VNATLALEDGTWYRGVAAGASGEARGEVVFNTSMTGYQEVLTDPSYSGQIVTMTAPQIGNYGVASGDAESQTPHVAGFIMREASPLASNWRADGTLRDYLVRHNIVAIADIDTRALTRVLRSAGVMRGVIATGNVDPAELVEKARAIPLMEGSDLVKGVTCIKPFEWRDRAGESGDAEQREFGIEPQSHAKRRRRVAAYDFGIKWNILRRLDAYGCDVHVFPAQAPASDLLAI